MKIWNVLLRLMGLFFLMLGSLLALMDGFEIVWWQLKDLLVICALASLFVTLIFSHWISGCIGAVASGLAVFALLRLHGDEIVLEWLRLRDTAIPLVNEYQHVNLPTDPGRWSGIPCDSRYFLVLAALVLGFWIGLNLLWKKTRFIALLLVACAYLGGLGVGNAPRILAVACLVLGVGFSMAAPVKGTTMIAFQASALALAGLALSVFVMAVAYQPLSKLLLKNHSLFLERQVQMEDALLELTSGGEVLNRLQWMFGGNEDKAQLSMEPPRQGDTVVFEMTVEEMPKSPLYVKNFTSVRYEDGVWYAEDGDLFNGYLEEKGLTAGKDLTREQLISEAAADEMTGVFQIVQDSIEPQRIVMDIKEKSGSTTLWPYFCDIPEGAQCVGDAGIRTGSSRYETYGYSMDNYEVVWYLEGSPLSSDDYGRYLSRALQEQADRANKILGTDPQAAFDALDECIYSFDLEPVPEGKDVVADFLFRQKKGYCMHFATAYALIWQSVNIPARYASGYVVLPGDFKKNDDGTYTAAVPQYRGHAWVEIYEQVFGWYPLEVTPPSYLQAMEEAGAGTSPQEVLGRQEPSEEPKEEPQKEPEELQQKEPEQPKEPEKPETPKDQEKEGDGQGAGSKEGSGGIWPILWPVLAWCLGTAAILAALVWLLRARVRWIWKRRDRAFGDEDANQAAQAVFSAILDILKISRIRSLPQETEGEFARRAEEALPWMEPGEFGAVTEIVQAARFGNAPISQEQRSRVFGLYQQAMAQALGQMDQKRRLWYQYFHVKVRN